MILRFGVQNFRSFRDYVEVSFVSTARQDEPTWRMPAPGTPHGVLPVIGVWGANASGKTNLLDVLPVLRFCVESSFTRLGPRDAVPWDPWKTLEEGGLPTLFDVDFLVAGVRHHFGFQMAPRGFIEEWLFAWPGGKKRVLYHRNQAEEDPWYFGPSLKGPNRTVARATRDNCLFLSAAAQFNHPVLEEVNKALASRIYKDLPVDLRVLPYYFKFAPILRPSLRQAVVQMLATTDTGITGFREVDDPAATGEVLGAFRKVFSKKLVSAISEDWETKGLPVEIRFTHRGPDGVEFELDPQNESKGTWILFSRLNDFLHLLDEGGILVLDEIDTSLHPDLCARLVDLFTSSHTNPKGAQILFSTHDRTLLTRLRSDEIVLVDKGVDGVSSLQAASDYKDVRARDDIRRAHEQGRLRGVPILGDFARIMAEALHHAS